MMTFLSIASIEGALSSSLKLKVPESQFTSSGGKACDSLVCCIKRGQDSFVGTIIRGRESLVCCIKRGRDAFDLGIILVFEELVGWIKRARDMLACCMLLAEDGRVSDMELS